MNNVKLVNLEKSQSISKAIYCKRIYRLKQLKKEMVKKIFQE